MNIPPKQAQFPPRVFLCGIDWTFYKTANDRKEGKFNVEYLSISEHLSELSALQEKCERYKKALKKVAELRPGAWDGCPTRVAREALKGAE